MRKSLYCQYPPIKIKEDGSWKAERVIIGNSIENLHIAEVNEVLDVELQNLASNNYYGPLPGPLQDQVASNIVATVPLKPYGRDDLYQK